MPHALDGIIHRGWNVLMLLRQRDCHADTSRPLFFILTETGEPKVESETTIFGPVGPYFKRNSSWYRYI